MEANSVMVNPQFLDPNLLSEVLGIQCVALSGPRQTGDDVPEEIEIDIPVEID